MKNKIVLGIAFVFMLLITMAGALADVESVFDNFEDGNFNESPTWTVDTTGGGSASVVSTFSKEGSNSLRLRTDGANDNAFLRLDTQYANKSLLTTGTNITTWVRFGQISNSRTDFVVQSTSGDFMGLFLLAGNIEAGVSGGAGNTVIFNNPKANRWYKFVITYEDTQADFYIYNESDQLEGSRLNAGEGTSDFSDFTEIQLRARDEDTSAVDHYYDVVNYGLINLTASLTTIQTTPTIVQPDSNITSNTTYTGDTPANVIATWLNGTTVLKQTTFNSTPSGTTLNYSLNCPDFSQCKLGETLTITFNATDGVSTVFQSKQVLIGVNLTLNVTDKITSSEIVNYTATVENIDTGGTETKISTGGQLSFYLNSGSYSVTVDHPDYAERRFNTTLENATQTVNVQMYRTNTLDINFKDQVDRSLITTGVSTLDLISDVYANNYSTSNGTLLIELLDPANYTLRYTSEGYTTRFYYVNLNNNSAQELDLYLVNESVAKSVNVTIIDQNSNEVEGAIVKALKYYIDLNQYITQEVSQTDINGIAGMSLTLNDEFYKFVVQYNGETLKITNPDVLTEDTLTIQIVIGEDIGAGYSTYINAKTTIDYSLSYNDSTNNFKLTFNNLDGLGSQLCLDVDKYKPNGKTDIDRSCSTSNSATILSSIAPLDNDSIYVAKVYYYSDGEEFFLDELSKSFTSTLPQGNLGLLMQVLLTLVMFFIVASSIELTAITVPLSLILGRYYGLHVIAYEYLIPMQIVGIIIAYILGRSKL